MRTNHEWLLFYEGQAAEFHAVMGVRIEDFLTFYKATARVPSAKEIVLINRFGVASFIKALNLRPELPKTLLADLEKLGAAKRTFAEACKQTLEKWLRLKTHGKF